MYIINFILHFHKTNAQTHSVIVTKPEHNVSLSNIKVENGRVETAMYKNIEVKGHHSMSFLALKKRRKQRTCQVARLNRQHMLKILKYRTRLLVDSGTVITCLLKLQMVIPGIPIWFCLVRLNAIRPDLIIPCCRTLASLLQ